MHGLLADVNIEGHQERIRQLLERSGLWTVLAHFGLRFVTLADLGLLADSDDRAVWQRCQQDGWVLLTDNRNDDGPNSLQATLNSNWSPGKLPVVTIANKSDFENSAEYRDRVANDVADLLFGILDGQFCDRDRIYVPR